MTAAIEEPTADGIIFRVDLRLRPEGRNGPAVQLARRGRGVLRDLRADLGAAGLAAGAARRRAIARWATSCWRCSSRSSTRAASTRAWSTRCAALRALFRDPADAGGALGETGFDVKLGAGGIRDVEMVVQALQLLHAGKRPRSARAQHAARRSRAWWWRACSSDREAWTLLSAYRFWRRLEHRVQVATGAQHHRLPGDDEARARFADGLGFASLAAFDAEVAAQARRGRGDRRDAGRAAAPRCTSEAARLLDPLRDRAELERLAARGRLPRRRGGRRHAGGGRGAAAGRAAGAGDRVARSGPGAAALSRPDAGAARTRCWRCCATSRSWRACWRRCSAPAIGWPTCCVRNPPMWDALVEGLGARRADARASCAARLAASHARRRRRQRRDEAEEEALEALRRFQTEETLRIGLHDVAGSVEARAR